MTRLFGANAVLDVLDAAPDAIRGILYSGRLDPDGLRVLERARKAGLPTREVEADELRQRSGGRGGASVAADLKIANAPEPSTLDPDRYPVLVALDQVTDPHNLGAILRSCAAFGVPTVLLPRDNSAPLNDAAARASAGAIAHVGVTRVTNLARTLGELHEQGYWPCAVTADAPASAWDTDLSALPIVLVMGAEGGGLRPLVRRACPLAIKLPMTGLIRSLNVSVAAGIALAEVARQRAKSFISQ